MRSGVIKAPIIINDLENDICDEVRVISSYHGNQRKNRLKPARSFKNWLKYFKNPYFCFIDISVFCLYLIFAVFHEKSSISFSVDLEKAIHSFLVGELSETKQNLNVNGFSTPKFINNQNKYKQSPNKNNQEATKINRKADSNMHTKKLQMIDPHQGIPFGEGQIYLIDDFIYILDSTTRTLFHFSSEFPMSHPIFDSGYVTLKIELLNGTNIEQIIRESDEIQQKTRKSASIFSTYQESSFDSKTDSPNQKIELNEKTFLNNKIKIKSKSTESNDNLPIQKFEFKNGLKPSDFVMPYLMTFKKVSVTMSYHLQIIGSLFDSRINLDIISDFEMDIRTDSIQFDIYHTRFQEKPASLLKFGTVLYTFNYSLPMVIIIFNVTAIFRLIKAIFDLYSYSKRKSEEVGRGDKFIFSKKFDKWNIFAICTHFLSITTMFLYIFIGQDIEEKVPPINVFLSGAAFMHSILLIRYLNLKDTTFLIITVLYKSSLILVKFLLGCLPFFFAFWAFGICFFGHLSYVFASPLQCASYLFCVMHGDSILALFDNTIIQNDYSVYLGFFYSSAWLAFSLLLMFNVTISIFQDVLRRENAKLAKNEVVEENHGPSPLHLDFLANNIPLMMNNNQYLNPNAFQTDSPL